MSDSPAESAPRAGTDDGTPPGAPRWVKVSGTVALAALVVFLILHLTGSGMGPGMHGGH